MDILESTIKAIKPLDKEVMARAQDRLDNMAKPIGGLGKLEDIAVKIAGIRGKVNNNIDKKNIVVMCSDNGIIEEGVSASPQEFTRILTENMAKGLTGVSVLAKMANAEITVVDVGINGRLEDERIIDRKIRRGTSNFSKGPSMSLDEAIKSIEIGIEIGDRLASEGYEIIGTGELGIGNTTTSAAILTCFSGLDVDKTVGKGAGLTNEQYIRKKKAINKGIEINKPDVNNPIDVLSKLGGFDIGAICGLYLSAAKNRLPIVIDGFISSAAALLAYKICPESREYMIPSHLSKEPGSKYMMKELGLEPMLDLEMRLGEGSGCPLAFNIIDSALSIMNNMASLDVASIDGDKLVDIR